MTSSHKLFLTSGRRRHLAIGLGVALVFLGAAAVTARALRDRQPEAARWTTGSTATLAVEPFHALDPKLASWAADDFAESLATRLGRLPGLEVRVAAAGATGTDYTLRGDVAERDGRLVIATRLHGSGERQPLWTATFWRSEAPSPNLVADLAADVAEALYGHLGRRAISPAGERM